MDKIITHIPLKGTTFADFIQNQDELSNWSESKKDTPLFQELIELDEPKKMMVKLNECSYLKSSSKYDLFNLFLNDFLKLPSEDINNIASGDMVTIVDSEKAVNDHVYEM